MQPGVGQFFVDREGRRRAVITPLAKYRRLLEDLHDLAVIAERRTEKTISPQEMKRRLRAYGRV